MIKTIRALSVFLFVVTAHAATSPISISIAGKGIVRGATNSQSLTIGSVYTVTATPAAGFAFRGWSGSTNYTKASLSFRMESNWALTATFEDVSRPTISITTPKANQRLLAPQFTVTGTARDNDRIKEVRVRVNGGAWTVSNGSNSWNASVTFKPGLNKLEAVASDFANRNSTTSSVTATYIVCEPVQFGANGPGKISPTPASCYEIGKTYTVLAVPKPGCIFDGWSGSSNTLSRTLKFQMRPGLGFMATFRDVTRPTITLTTTAKIETPASEFTIAGKATDNVSVAKVFWSANGGQWIEADGSSSWRKTIPLEPGPNRVRVYTQDTTGNVSPTREISIMSVRELARVYFPMHPGNEWTYLGLLGRVTRQLSSREDGVFILKDVGPDLSETYYKHNADFSKVLNLGGMFDTTFITAIPPIAELDQKYLAHGGSWTVLSTALAVDPTFPVPEVGLEMKFALKITVVPQVTVPAGAFFDCRRLDNTVWAFIPGTGWKILTKETFVYAPNVGPIQSALYRELPTGGFQFVGWQSLENATVDGVQIGLTRVAPFAAVAPQIPADLDSINSSVVPLDIPSLSGYKAIKEAISQSLKNNPVTVSSLQSPILEIIQIENNFGFTFSTEIGRTYRVQATFDLLNWEDLIPPFTTEEDEYQFADPKTLDAFRFYRVIAE